ncbi:14514_t:CDS:2, partial [Racocetra persica]
SRFAMHQIPFWDPQVFIPTMGMLLGNCMSAIAVGVSYALEQFSEQKEKIEMYLAFGASRWEAGRPVATEAIRLAMLPTINSMRNADG